MSGYAEMYRGVVYPQQCDHLGHMTVMYYVGMFDQATWHLMSAMGATWENMKTSGAAFVDAKHTIEYRAEQQVGSLIVVESALTRLGTKSMTTQHRMKNTETGVLAATSEIVLVHFDLESRASIPIPDAMRERLQGFLVEGSA